VTGNPTVRKVWGQEYVWGGGGKKKIREEKKTGVIVSKAEKFPKNGLGTVGKEKPPWKGAEKKVKEGEVGKNKKPKNKKNG